MLEKQEEKYFELSIEDGILYLSLPFEQYTELMIDAGIKQRLALTQEKAYPFFADITNLKSITFDARERLTREDAAFGTKVVAFLIKSKVQEVLYNFFQILHKSPAPSRMFTNKEKALVWLEKYK